MSSKYHLNFRYTLIFLFYFFILTFVCLCLWLLITSLSLPSSLLFFVYPATCIRFFESTYSSLFPIVSLSRLNIIWYKIFGDLYSQNLVNSAPRFFHNTGFQMQGSCLLLESLESFLKYFCVEFESDRKICLQSQGFEIFEVKYRT